MNPNEEMICIVLPLYKNEEAVGKLVEQLKKNIIHHPFNIIAIDDASPDASGEVLHSTARDLNISCRVIRNTKNLGQHKSILKGLTEGDGTVFVVMDADLQDPPHVVPEMIEQLITKKASLVIACRHKEKTNTFKSLSSYIFKRLLQWAIKTKVPVGIGEFYAIRFDVRDQLLKDKNMDPSLLPLYLVNRASTTYHYFHRSTRPYGKSSYTFRLRLRYALHIMKNIRKLRADLQGAMGREIERRPCESELLRSSLESTKLSTTPTGDPDASG